MSTTALHPNALPGIPWTFQAKTIVATSTSVVCFRNEAITNGSFSTESATFATISETATQPTATETVEAC